MANKQMNARIQEDNWVDPLISLSVSSHCGDLAENHQRLDIVHTALNFEGGATRSVRPVGNPSNACWDWSLPGMLLGHSRDLDGDAFCG